MTADQVVVKIAREKILSRQSATFWELPTIIHNVFKSIRNEKEKTRAYSGLDNRRTEHGPQKCFICGSKDHLIAKFTKPPKDNEKRRKIVYLNEKGNCVYNNGKNSNNQKIYASMERIYDNNECSSRSFGDSLQLTNWILDSGAMFHMTPKVSDFILGSLEDTDKN